MKTKISLKSLEVKSFITQIEESKVKGGLISIIETQCACHSGRPYCAPTQDGGGVACQQY